MSILNLNSEQPEAEPQEAVSIKLDIPSDAYHYFFAQFNGRTSAEQPETEETELTPEQREAIFLELNSLHDSKELQDELVKHTLLLVGSVVLRVGSERKETRQLQNLIGTTIDYLHKNDSLRQRLLGVETADNVIPLPDQSSSEVNDLMRKLIDFPKTDEKFRQAYDIFSLALLCSLQPGELLSVNASQLPNEDGVIATAKWYLGQSEK